MISQIFNRCGLWSLIESECIYFGQGGLRNWSLVGDKKWFLLGSSECTIVVVVAIGALDLVSAERLVASQRGR